MFGSDLIDEYREWLFDIIRFDDYCDRYERLLDFLSGKPFTWSVDHDENRAEDGYALRWKFASEFSVDEDFWVGRMPVRCSVLEMMIALSMRCEDVISDPEKGDRTAVWFWRMVANLGLWRMHNQNFDRTICEEKIDILLKRQYERNGIGGLFKIRDKTIDMRKAEIWYQMSTWIMENFEI